MKNIYFLYFIVLTLTACQKDDLTPSWLIINEFDFVTDESTQGPNSEGITDAWVYMDNEALGVFSLPARIPILAEGTHDFTIYAGIKVNGISATRTRYPFYNRFDGEITLIKNEEVEVSPPITYKSNIQFQLLEDFEDVGIDFLKDILSDTNINIISEGTHPEIVEYGNSCGMITLSSSDSLYKGTTNTNLNLPGGEDVYVEIDYMNTNSIAMGVVAKNSGGTNEHTPLVILNSQVESELKWKKIYINIKEDVSFEVNATSFEIFLLSILDTDKSDAIIYLDNIKVIRYE
ncbi:MAG: hypothetical protein ACI857_001756 [Arenicella sp.]|jgi:hypothetical protein